MKVRIEDKFRGRGKRKCRMCGSSDALIRSHGLYVCRRCFREIAGSIGFKKYG